MAFVSPGRAKQSAKATQGSKAAHQPSFQPNLYNRTRTNLDLSLFIVRRPKLRSMIIREPHWFFGYADKVRIELFVIVFIVIDRERVTARFQFYGDHNRLTRIAFTERVAFAEDGVIG